MIYTTLIYSLAAIVILLLLYVILKIKNNSSESSTYWIFSILRKFVKYNPFENTEDYALIRARDYKAGQPARGKAPFISHLHMVKIKVQDSEINARVYHPQPEKKLPLLVFYHGGGWVLGSLDTHDEVCRKLALETPSVVLSVEYRLAPEFPFPSAAEDAWDALVWAKDHASEIGADPDRIAVMGDSSGGNLAAVTAQRARGIIELRCQILLYPVTDLTHTDTASYIKYAEGYFLSRDIMEKFISVYTPDKKDRFLPQASPLLQNDLRGLAPALVITAACDVLRDEGEDYAKKMAINGVEVVQERARGMVHGFITMGGIIAPARRHITRCARYAADKLK